MMAERNAYILARLAEEHVEGPLERRMNAMAGRLQHIDAVVAVRMRAAADNLVEAEQFLQQTAERLDAAREEVGALRVENQSLEGKLLLSKQALTALLIAKKRLEQQSQELRSSLAKKRDNQFVTFLNQVGVYGSRYAAGQPPERPPFAHQRNRMENGGSRRS